ncbi:hypothetical protein GCM10018987_09780 [Streptomyces cremeus]
MVTVFEPTGFAPEDRVAFDVLLELPPGAGREGRLQTQQSPDDALGPVRLRAGVLRAVPAASAGTARPARSPEL